VDFTVGPLGSKVRFDVVAASPGDQSALKGAGTYGLIKKAAGIIIGAVSPLPRAWKISGMPWSTWCCMPPMPGLVPAGSAEYSPKSNFAIKIKAAQGEIVPAVVSLGYIENLEKAKNRAMRVKNDAINRNAWEDIFQRKIRYPLDR